MVKQLKTQRLCEELNMNFDEANELFADETLQSMQMARVVGGGTATFPKWSQIIDTISKCTTVAEAWNYVKKAFEQAPTKAPDQKDTNGSTVDLKNGTIISPVGETIVFSADSVTVKGAYGVKVLIGPGAQPTNTPN